MLHVGWLTTVVALAFVIGLPACGGGDDDVPEEQRDQITATFEELQKAFAADDLDAICEHMTINGQERAGDAAHGVGAACNSNLERYFGLIREGGGFKPSNRQPEIASMEKDPDGVTVTVELPGGAPTALPFVEEEGVWKLDSLFGSSASYAKRFASEIDEASFPEPDGEELVVTDVDGKPCPDFDTDLAALPRRVAGGCAFEWMAKKHMPVTVSTVFGDFHFADCNLGITSRVDASGQTWTTDTNLGAREDGTSACGDVYRCTGNPAVDDRDPGSEWPWRGRISSDGNGGYVHRIALCWETCVGFFVGDLVLDVRREGDTWRAEARDVQIGTSGLTLDNSLGLTKGGFDVSAPA